MAEPKTYLDFINQAFSNPDYVKAQKEASDLASQAPTFLADKQKELQTNDPLLQQLNAERAKFTGQLYSKPLEARSQYADILDPVKREALVSQAVGNIASQLSGTQGLIQARQGTQDQLAQRAYDVFKAQLGQKQDTAESMRSLLKDVAGKSYDAKEKRDLYLFEQQNKRFAPTGDSTTTKTNKYKVKYNYDRTTGKYSGVSFLNDKGQKIPAVQYSVDTGTPLDSLLVGTGNPGDEAVASLIQEARNKGQSEEEILSDLLASGQYNHLFGISSPATTAPKQSQDKYNTGTLGAINKIAEQVIPAWLRGQ